MPHRTFQLSDPHSRLHSGEHICLSVCSHLSQSVDIVNVSCCIFQLRCVRVCLPNVCVSVREGVCVMSEFEL